MIARVEIAKGSVETIAIDIADRFSNLANLDDSTKTYEITSPNTEGTPIVSGNADNIDGTLTGLVQIDTTNSDLPAGEYWLFFIFTADTDTPRLGPVVVVIT